MTSAWTDILSYEQIMARNIEAAELDPCFVRRSISFWSSRTIKQLQTLKAQAWYANDAEQFQMARSYLRLSAVEA
jgi:hypothetical protein